MDQQTSSVASARRELGGAWRSGGYSRRRNAGFRTGSPVQSTRLCGVHDLAQLAAAYAFGIARNHPFVDGNKRAALISAGLFLSLNGQRLVADKVDAYEVTLALAAGDTSEDDFANWIRKNSRSK